MSRDKTRITINDNYCIDVDDHNHDLKKLIPEHESATTKKMVAEKWETIGHYPNVMQCLNAAVRLESYGEDCSIYDWMKKLKELGDKYHSVF